MFAKGNQKVLYLAKVTGTKGVATDHPVVHSVCLVFEALL